MQMFEEDKTREEIHGFLSCIIAIANFKSHSIILKAAGKKEKIKRSHDDLISLQRKWPPLNHTIRDRSYTSSIFGYFMANTLVREFKKIKHCNILSCEQSFG